MKMNYENGRGNVSWNVALAHCLGVTKYKLVFL